MKAEEARKIAAKKTLTSFWLTQWRKENFGRNEIDIIHDWIRLNAERGALETSLMGDLSDETINQLQEEGYMVIEGKEGTKIKW